MKSLQLWSVSLSAVIITVLMLSGCTPGGMPERIGSNKCYYGEVDYVSVFQWKGIVYTDNYDKDISGIKKGEEVGDIRYRKADHTCPREPMQDGDATLLEVGTKLYEVKGYKTPARLIAGDRLFVASDNPTAQTMNDLLDIAGKIKTVRFISGMDSSPLKDFSPEAAEVFIREYPKLKYVPFKQLYKENKGLAGGDYWLEIELIDGTRRTIIYNTKFAVFNPSAYATPELAKLVEAQRKLIYVK
ncbi:hypothetical protein [Paenibacillus sp. HW567]|uniref:hypothetical protein n=1 Tax=Paenibacillus sp. HW567 TaxID=1034769 RepID=UPI00037DDA9F|nr:hypothetical protein [Paenibacillus sp. HW567]